MEVLMSENTTNELLFGDANVANTVQIYAITWVVHVQGLLRMHRIKTNGNQIGDRE